jgi:hypothetical protein
MAVATQKQGRSRTKKEPVTPTRDQVIAMVLELGGEPERKRYEKIEGLEKTHARDDVLHHWKVGSILGESFQEHDEETIRVYSIGLQRKAQTLRLSVRLAELYSEPQVRELLQAASTAGHELNWGHFRQLLHEGLTEAQRADLVRRVTKNRWGYRELQDKITAMLGGKKSQGGRKPGKTKYRTYAGALSAMKLRSQAWLALEEDWIIQVKDLVLKLGEDEKLTPEFVATTKAAAAQLRSVANKAQRDAEEAEAIAAEVDKALGHPELTPEAPAATVPTTNGAPKHNGVPRTRTKAKAKAKTAPGKPGKRIRLAKHPKMTG